MEKAIGGLPQYDSIEAMIAKMDEAGVEKVFITQCKMWSYRNKWMYMDTKLWRKWRNTRHVIPTVSSALPATILFALRNPCRKSNSAIKVHGFKGVYIHIYGFDIPLHDAKMYPLYAKCDELKMPDLACKWVMCWKRCPANMPGRYTWIASPAISRS